MTPPTDLQKKDDLRRERRFLNRIKDAFERLVDMEILKSESVYKETTERIEDIEKALED